MLSRISTSGIFVFLAVGVLALALDSGKSSAEYELKQNADGTAAIAENPPNLSSASALPQGGTAQQPMMQPTTTAPAVVQQVMSSATPEVEVKEGPCSAYSKIAYAFAACEDRIERIERVKAGRKGKGSKTAKDSTPPAAAGTMPAPSLAESNAALMAGAGVPSVPAASAPLVPPPAQ